MADKMIYLNFDLHIEGSDEGYRARVSDSPAGAAVTRFALPFSELEFENFLLRVGRPRRGIRRLESSQKRAVRSFGARLFDMVFGGDVGACLQRSLDQADREGVGLRIRLRLTDVPELAVLPWEYLYNAKLNRFLSLSVKTPIVRYLELPESVKPLAVRPPLKVLVMMADAKDHPSLDVEREWAGLKGALAILEERGLVEIERLDAATLTLLLQHLRRREYHILHFIGHGGFDERDQDGMLIMQSEQGHTRQVSGEGLGIQLHDHIPPLQLVVLNACEGARTAPSDPFAGVAQKLVQQGVPAVIAMQFEITEQAATTFAGEFYSALADGYPVDAALAEARKAIFAQENDVEWGTPVLYMRSPDGRLFDIEQSPGMRTLFEQKKEAEEQLAETQGQLKEWKGKLDQTADSGLRASLEEMIRVLEEDVAANKQKIEAIEEEMARLNVARADRFPKGVDEASEQEQLAELYDQGIAYSRNAEWASAIDVFQEILGIDEHYRDTLQKLVQAKREQCLLQWKERFLRHKNYFIAFLILTVITVGALWFWPHIRGRLLPIVTTTTPTPSIVPTSPPMPIGEVWLKIDEAVDTGSGPCRGIVRESSHRIEVTVLDSGGTPLWPGAFSYRWYFNPPDQYNQERSEKDFRGNAIIYRAPPGLSRQIVTAEVLQERKTVAARSICFIIKEQP